MKTIKILCFFLIIVTIYLIYKFNKISETFQCKRHKEFQVVFHTFDWQPKVDGITLLNYVNEDYLNKKNLDFKSYVSAVNDEGIKII